MNAISNIVAQENLDEIMEKACNDRLPMIINRPFQPPVVMISLEDYQSLEATAYRLRSPNNAKRLLDSMSALENGQGVERELLD